MWELERAPVAGDSILLVEDSQTQALRTRLVLEKHGFRVEVCSTGTMALARAAEVAPDMILLDMHLPDMSGREVARRLKDDPYLTGIPIIFVTEVFREIADVVTGFDLGVDDYLIKPVDDSVLVARIRASLRAKRTQRDLGRLARMLMTVNQLGLQLASILDRTVLLQTVARLVRENFDYPSVHVYLLEENRLLPVALEGMAAGSEHPPLELDGPWLASLTASSGEILPGGTAMGEALPPSPFLPGGRGGLAVPFRSGGEVSGVLEVYSADPLPFQQLDRVALQTLADLVGIALQNARLYHVMETLASHDSLTGLLSRRALLERLMEECDRSRRYRSNLSVLLVDCDQFKEINDTYGHGAGDQALQAVADIFRCSIREVDRAGRLGGDEFLVVLPETGSEQALLVAERIRSAVQAQGLQNCEGRSFQFSLSIGVATRHPGEWTGQGELLHAADEALYRAKAAGGNRAER